MACVCSREARSGLYGQYAPHLQRSAHGWTGDVWSLCAPRPQPWALEEGVRMATMTYGASTSALAPRTSAVSPAVRPTDHLTFVVEYAEAFHLAVAMHAL